MLPTTKFSTVSCLAALLSFGSLAAAPTANAGDATYLAPDASHCDIFRVLSRDIPGECRGATEAPKGLRTRSIKFHAPQQAAAQSMAAATPAEVREEPGYDVASMTDEPDELSLAMRIQFRLNSDVLTDEAMASLDGIAAVLNNDIMIDKIVMLEGHADASGSDTYNLDLSVRRARAVKAYLMTEHQIADWRLPFTGKGEAEPFDPSAPASAINRRVEFTNITG